MYRSQNHRQIPTIYYPGTIRAFLIGMSLGIAVGACVTCLHYA